MKINEIKIEDESLYINTPDILAKCIFKGKETIVRVPDIGLPPVCELDLKGLSLMVAEKLNTNSKIEIIDFEMAKSLS